MSIYDVFCTHWRRVTGTRTCTIRIVGERTQLNLNSCVIVFAFLRILNTVSDPHCIHTLALEVQYCIGSCACNYSKSNRLPHDNTIEIKISPYFNTREVDDGVSDGKKNEKEQQQST